jgi:hypothetical protein
MIKNIIIVAPNYDPKSGGAIALHKLCDVINQLGRKAYLCPAFENRFINAINCDTQLPHLNDDLWRLSIDQRIEIKTLPKVYPKADDWLTKLKRIKRIIFNQSQLPLLANSQVFKLKTNPSFNTPTLSLAAARALSEQEDTVVIYAEIMAGNPLSAKNVVRWLLHDPGFHSGHIYYEMGELYFRFNSAIKPFSFPGSNTSEQYLTVVQYPLDLYNLDGALPESERRGTAYCLRKGAYKPITHDLSNSVCIDQLPHEEVAKIFKRVTHFYCYDTLTAYYHLAAVCDCKVVIIPDEGVAKENWLTPEARLGIAYGLADKEISPMPKETALFLKNEEAKAAVQVENCLVQIDAFFSKSHA